MKEYPFLNASALRAEKLAEFKKQEAVKVFEKLDRLSIYSKEEPFNLDTAFIQLQDKIINIQNEAIRSCEELEEIVLNEVEYEVLKFGLKTEMILCGGEIEDTEKLESINKISTSFGTFGIKVVEENRVYKIYEAVRKRNEEYNDLIRYFVENGVHNITLSNDFTAVILVRSNFTTVLSLKQRTEELASKAPKTKYFTISSCESQNFNQIKIRHSELFHNEISKG